MRNVRSAPLPARAAQLFTALSIARRCVRLDYGDVTISAGPHSFRIADDGSYVQSIDDQPIWVYGPPTPRS